MLNCKFDSSTTDTLHLATQPGFDAELLPPHVPNLQVADAHGCVHIWEKSQKLWSINSTGLHVLNHQCRVVMRSLPITTCSLSLQWEIRPKLLSFWCTTVCMHTFQGWVIHSIDTDLGDYVSRRSSHQVVTALKLLVIKLFPRSTLLRSCRQFVSTHTSAQTKCDISYTWVTVFKGVSYANFFLLELFPGHFKICSWSWVNFIICCKFAI